MVTTHRLMTAVVGACLGLTAAGTSGQVLPPSMPGEHMVTAAAREATARATFDRHVQDYVALRRRFAADLPPLNDCPDLETARGVIDVLATRIRAARAEARQGELFTPDVVPLFKKYVALKVPPELAAAIVAEQVPDEAGVVPRLAVNMTWPEAVPCSYMPARLLLALPPLPPELQYRFLGRSLVVLDVQANLIVDFLPGVLPT